MILTTFMPVIVMPTMDKAVSAKKTILTIALNIFKVFLYVFVCFLPDLGS